MDKIHVCCLCLARKDLIHLTEEKKCLINSLLHQELSKDVICLICINCTNTLSCVDKFQKNSTVSQKILKEQQISVQDKNDFLDVPPETQGKLTDGFETVLNWLSGVNVILNHHSMKKKEKSGAESSKKNNGSSSKEKPSETVTQPDIQFVDPQKLYLGEGDVVCELLTSNEIKKEDEKVKENADLVDLMESSSEEPDDPIDMNNDNNEVTEEQQQMENPTETIEDLKKYRVNTKKRGNTQYECPECQKLFVLGKLKYHLNLHRGLRPFKCLVKRCSKDFFSPYNAATHCNRVHKLNVTSSKWTGSGMKSPNVSDSPKTDQK